MFRGDTHELYVMLYTYAIKDEDKDKDAFIVQKEFVLYNYDDKNKRKAIPPIKIILQSLHSTSKHSEIYTSSCKLIQIYTVIFH